MDKKLWTIANYLNALYFSVGMESLILMQSMGQGTCAG
jgi:hypothetical protein